jgi:excisionase family DNA binding protein
MPESLFYRRKDAAEILDCDPRTIDRGIEEGAIPAVRIGTNIRIPVQAFHEATNTQPRVAWKPTLPDTLTLTVPEAGKLLGLGRDAAHEAAERDEIPTLRIGKRIIVPTAKLLLLLGVVVEAKPPSTNINRVINETRNDHD